jgi:hypothetical protein
MTQPAAASLMDDAEFLAELEQIEMPTVANRRPAPAPIAVLKATVNRSVASESPLRESDLAEAVLPEAAIRREPLWALDGVEEHSTLSLSRGETVVAVLGVVLMMALGAAGAALVFHGRLALILGR